MHAEAGERGGSDEGVAPGEPRSGEHTGDPLADDERDGRSMHKLKEVFFLVAFFCRVAAVCLIAEDSFDGSPSSPRGKHGD